MYFGGRKDVEEAEYKALLTNPKDGVSGPKPSEVRNGDLVSLLLAATPPYLYNMPLVPHTFFFSEMLRSFVQAKAERQNTKVHHVHRRRKRAWRESTPTKPDPEPLELTTPRAAEKASSPPPKRAAPSCDFTAEKLANSSVTPEASPGEMPLPAPPLWYPNMYPQPPYPIDPLHFFIDLRVSAHVWDRKLSSERTVNTSDDLRATSPLNLVFDKESNKVDLHKCRHNSAFSVPSRNGFPNQTYERSSQSVHYLMGKIKDIYAKKVTKEEDEEKKEVIDGGKKDLPAMIGLELVVDYVKHESDESEDDDEEEDNEKGEITD